MRAVKKFCSIMILPIWIAAGAAIGVALDNVGAGIGIGIAIGVAVTATKRKRKSEDEK
jgi:F0F1-type ATP synthase membrane subunit c/vacuolar-type H+-ATPase subunit K